MKMTTGLAQLSRAITPSTRLALAAVAVLATVPGLSPAADITLTANDVAGQSSFNTGLHWSDGLPPAPGNAYFVNSTTASLAVRTPVDNATDITFAGDSLTLTGTTAFNSLLTIKNLTGVNTTVNNLTLNGGQVQNGGTSTGAATAETLTSNLITLGTIGGTLNAGGGGRTLTVNAPISGTGPLSVLGNGGNANINGNITTTGSVTLNSAGGFVGLTGTNTYGGTTTISGSSIATTGAGGVAGAVRASDGIAIPATSALALTSGVLETGTDITRPLGTAAGQISITGAAAGFTAFGAPVTVAIGGTAAPTPLTWGSAAFNPTVLVLNDFNGNNTLTFANNIDLAGASTATIRTIFSSAGTSTVQSVISGVISGVGSVGFYGNSTTVLTQANPYTGDTTIGLFLLSGTTNPSGVVRVAASGALGAGLVTIGSGGNGVLGRLELANNSTIGNTINLPSRTTGSTSVAIESVSGANTLSGTIGITSGGSVNLIQSDVGSTLTLSGANGGGFALQSLGGARVATFQGTGNGVVSGIIRDSNAVSGATIGITKSGTGTWALTAANTYTGVTTVSAGTLSLGDGTTGHDGTVATTANIVNNANLLYNRFGSVSSDRVISGSGTVTKSGVGTQTLTGANTYTGNTVITAGTLRATTPAYTSGAVYSGTAGTDIQGGRLVLDYTGGATPLAAVKATLTTGYAEPTPFATGLLRSTNATSAIGLGYADNGTAVTVMRTYYGDANLDGQVDFNDFIALQTNYLSPDTNWDQGNFNYDNVTDFNDFIAIQTNYGQSINGANVSFTSEQVGIMNAFFAANTTEVPEPASLAVLGLGATALLRRRRA